MELARTRCAICGSLEDYKVLYKKNFTEPDLSPTVFSARRPPDRLHYQMVRCNKDNLIRSNPVSDSDLTYELYAKSKFIYGDETENLSISYLGVLKPLLCRLPKSTRILEIGCGNGFLLKKLGAMGYKNVFGIEPCIDAVQKADREISGRIITGILRPGLFEKDSFDLICLFQTLEHIQDPGKFLDICCNILSPQGFILAVSHDVESLPAKILREASPIIDIGHAYLYSKKTIQAVFEKHNFKPACIRSSTNTVSLRYLLWLMPIPAFLKTALLNSKFIIFNSVLKKKIRINLGNLCIIATKAENSGAPRLNSHGTSVFPSGAEPSEAVPSC